LQSLLKSSSESTSRLTAVDFAKFFAKKIDSIRESTAESLAPVIVDRSVDEPLSVLRPTTVDKVAAVLRKSAAKQCLLDPVPTWLLKESCDIFAPILSRMCNASFLSSQLPTSSKRAIVRPLLKKQSMDPNDPSSYRPISNLSFVSKVIEKIVDVRISEHVRIHHLLPVHQSAYRRHHSTETAIICVMNDMINVLDRGHVGALMLLDMSAAFDTVDHSILVDILRRRFGIRDAALNWLEDFLTSRSQAIRLGTNQTDDVELKFGVPQGSVTGPKRFIEYAEDVTHQFHKNNLRHHLFADDMQAMASGPPSCAGAINSSLETCLSDVSSWCAAKRLQLNAGKTDVMWFGTAAMLRKMPSGHRGISTNVGVIEPVSVVRDLGVWIDSELTMREHVSHTARACFFHLRRLRSIRKLLGRDVTIQLVCALVLSRLDYCNGVLAGLPTSTLAPLQRVLHAAARLVDDLKPNDHVTAALKNLHWLPVKQRIEYKQCLLMHKVRVGQAPVYMSDMLTACSAVPSLARLRSSTSGDYIVPRTTLKLGERAFSVSAPLLWNALPSAIKSSDCTTTFKRLLKTHLFKSAYHP
jgi:Reverse transcriptase (RNA-dependent DNA polymerase)